MTISNRHKRHKAVAFETRMMKASEVRALGFICAWEGCMATCKHSETEYLPKGWTVLLMFWTGKPVLNIWDDVPQSDMLRDTYLCPEHTQMLDLQLRPLPSRLMMREAEGSA